MTGLPRAYRPLLVARFMDRLRAMAPRQRRAEPGIIDDATLELNAGYSLLHTISAENSFSAMATQVAAQSRAWWTGEPAGARCTPRASAGLNAPAE